jgi:hypothetical protein
MSSDVEKPRRDAKNGTLQSHLRTPKEPTHDKTAHGSEMLPERDWAILMTLFEWLAPGRERDGLSRYVTLLFMRGCFKNVASDGRARRAAASNRSVQGST